jgi:hypothetical protein
MACRGSGRVISNLGGSPSELGCPWCEGTGVRVPGVDAQALWADRGDGEAGGGEGGGGEGGGGSSRASTAAAHEGGGATGSAAADG